MQDKTGPRRLENALATLTASLALLEREVARVWGPRPGGRAGPRCRCGRVVCVVRETRRLSA